MDGSWITRTSLTQRLIGGRERPLCARLGAEATLLLMWLLEVSPHHLKGESLTVTVREDIEVYLGLRDSVMTHLNALELEGYIKSVEGLEYEIGRVEEGQVVMWFHCHFVSRVMEMQSRKALEAALLKADMQRLHVELSSKSSGVEREASSLIEEIAQRSDDVARTNALRRAEARAKKESKPMRPTKERTKTLLDVMQSYKLLYRTAFGEEPQDLYSGGRLSSEGGRVKALIDKAGSAEMAEAFLFEVMGGGRAQSYAALYRHGGGFDATFLNRIVGEVSFALRRGQEPMEYVKSIRLSKPMVQEATQARNKATEHSQEDDF